MAKNGKNSGTIKLKKPAPKHNKPGNWRDGSVIDGGFRFLISCALCHIFQRQPQTRNHRGGNHEGEVPGDTAEGNSDGNYADKMTLIQKKGKRELAPRQLTPPPPPPQW